MWLIAPDRLEARLPGAPDPYRRRPPTIRSWNQFSAFIEEWDELRRRSSVRWATFAIIATHIARRTTF